MKNFKGIRPADEETPFLSDAALAHCLSASDFSLAGLHKKIHTARGAEIFLAGASRRA
jgi:hypothetical protein